MNQPCLVCLLGPALLCSLAPADEKSEAQPELIRQVQPEYDAETQRSFIVEPVIVELTIDDMGVPFALNARGDLPDNVVHALSQWRYRPARKDGRNVAFRSQLTVPVQKPLTRQTETSLRRTWRPPTKQVLESLMKGAALDAAGAAQIEQNLESDPGNSEDRRITLLAYYGKSAAKTGGAGEVTRNQGRHVAWLVENTPDAAILGSPLAVLNPTAESSQAAIQQMRELWLGKLNLQPDNIDVLEHATNFLRVVDPEQTERALLPWVRKSSRPVVWLGDLYGLAALGVNGLDPETGFPNSAASQLPDSPFSRRARSILSSTTDARLLFSGLAAVSFGGRALSRSGNVPSGYLALCEELLRRAKQALPDTADSCDPAAPLPDDGNLFRGLVQRVRVGAAVQQANLIKQVRPTYPQEAKSRHVEGTVRFATIIGKDGKIQTLNLISGPLSLYHSARSAVLQWEYTPVMLNGQPVEVATVIEVNYKLQQ